MRGMVWGSNARDVVFFLICSLFLGESWKGTARGKGEGPKEAWR